MKPLGSLNWQKWIMLLTGFMLCAVGLAVMYGWKTHSMRLIQIDEALPGMQFNTALCTLFLGISCIGIALQRKWFIIFSLLSLLIAALTLCQYIFHVDFHIDKMFASYKLAFPMKYQGRMAINTAICIILGSSCLLMMKNLEKAYGMIQFLSCILLAISSIALFGFLTGLESSFVWSDFTRMGVQSAVSFFILGWTLFICSAIFSFSKHKFSYITPISVALGMMLGSIGLWQAFNTQEYLNFRQISQEAAESVAKDAESVLHQYTQSFQRIANRWHIYRKLPNTLWQKELPNYFNDMPGLMDLQIVNFEPLEKEFIKMKLLLSDHGRCFIEKSKNGLITIFVPIYENGNIAEVVVGKINFIHSIENSISDYTRENYQVFVYDDGSFVAALGNVHEPILSSGAASYLKFDELSFRFDVFPLQKFFDSHKSELSNIVLYLGIVLTLLGTLLSYFAQQFYHQKSEAEAVSFAKSNFLANMSHEIRTPLNGIIGTTTLLNETALDDKQIKYVNRIYSSGKMLLNIICNILDISKIEAGELTIESIPCNLEAVLKDATDDFQEAALRKGLEFSIYYPEDTNFNVLSDPFRLKQILINLIGNAVKFTKKGSIHVSMKPVEESSKMIKVLFAIKDTGIGISPETSQQLFRTFSQADSSTSREFGGTGLGLAICKELVEKMDGEIGLESTKRVGSTFWILIPFNKNETVK